jgi:hypothetical protein
MLDRRRLGLLGLTRRVPPYIPLRRNPVRMGCAHAHLCRGVRLVQQLGRQFAVGRAAGVEWWTRVPCHAGRDMDV